jgi:hypothetical protein
MQPWPHSWFIALSHSPLGQLMQTSKWGFAIVETVHLLALALLGGSVLIIDLRLLGVIFKRESAPRIGRDLGRLLLGSLVIMILSGIALLSEEALKCYFSPAFRWKMALLATAVLFYFTFHRRAVLRTGSGAPTPWSRVVAVISMALWLGVGVAGRVIGLL